MLVAAAALGAVVIAVAIVIALRLRPHPPIVVTSAESIAANSRDLVVTDTRKVQPVKFDSNESTPDPRSTIAEPGSHYDDASLQRQKVGALQGTLGREIPVPPTPIVVMTASPSPKPPALNAPPPVRMNAPAPVTQGSGSPGTPAPQQPRSVASAAAVAAIGYVPRIVQKFNGDAIRDSPAPPDLQIAVGPRYIIQVNNAKLVMWDKIGKTIGRRPVYTEPIRATGNRNGRYNGVFPVNSGLRLSDPWMQYDRATNRIFIVAVELDEAFNSGLFLAVSRDDDPRHGWNVSPITGLNKNGVLHDQPKLAVNGDHVAIAWTDMQGPPPGYAKGAMWDVISTRDLLGAKPRVVAKTLIAPMECDAGLIPVKSTTGAGDTYFVELIRPDQADNCRRAVPTPRAADADDALIGNDLRIFRITGSVAKKTAAVRVFDVEVPPYSAPGAAPQRQDHRKPNNAADVITVDTGDTRLLSAVMHDGEIWTAGNVACRVKGTKVSRACFQIFRVATTGDRRTLKTYTIGDKQLDLFDPAIAINRRGDVFVAFESTSSTTYPSSGFTAHLAGSDYAWKPFVIEDGRGVLNCLVAGNNRVGDYLGIDADASDGVVWAAVEVSTDRNHPCSQETIITALGR